MIAAQQLNTKPLMLPLLQLNPNILTVARCLALSPKAQKNQANCQTNLQNIGDLITISQPQQLQIQDENSLKSANLDVMFQQSKQYIEDVTALLLKEAQLRRAKASVDEINQVRQQSLALLAKLPELQNKIDAGLDEYKHKLDVGK